MYLLWIPILVIVEIPVKLYSYCNDTLQNRFNTSTWSRVGRSPCPIQVVLFMVCCFPIKNFQQLPCILMAVTPKMYTALVSLVFTPFPSQQIHPSPITESPKYIYSYHYKPKGALYLCGINQTPWPPTCNTTERKRREKYGSKWAGQGDGFANDSSSTW